jgi:hypothetical protein
MRDSAQIVHMTPRQTLFAAIMSKPGSVVVQSVVNDAASWNFQRQSFAFQPGEAS